MITRKSFVYLLLSVLIFTSRSFSHSAGEILVSNIGDASSGGIKRFDAQSGAFIGDLLPDRAVKGMVRSGDLVIAADSRGSVMVRINMATLEASTFGAGNLDGPYAVALGPDGTIYVGDKEAVKRFDLATGEFLGVFAPRANVLGLGFSPQGHLFTSSLNGLQEYDAAGQLLRNVATGFFNGLNFDAAGNLYVSSMMDRVVLRFPAPAYSLRETFTSGGNLSGPGGLSFDQENQLYVVSNLNNSVKKFNAQTGDFIADFVPSGANGLTGPASVLHFAPMAQEEAPLLKIALNASAQEVTLSWPASAAAYRLQTASSVPGDWNLVEAAPEAGEREMSLTLPASAAMAAFRLIKN